MKNKVYQGQSVFDKSVEITGSAENAFALALENNISITDILPIGKDLIYSGKVVKRVSELFSDTNRCATALTQQENELIISDDGIGKMSIENTFIIR